MKSRVRILSGIIAISLIFISGVETNAQSASKYVVLKKKDRVRAVYGVEEDVTVVEALNLAIRESIDKDLVESLRINVHLQVPGRRVTAPEMVRISIDYHSRKGRFSDDRLLTIYSGDRKIELTSIRDVWRSQDERSVFESLGFLIPYATFRELIKEKNVKMTVAGEEFELPGWIRGQLKNLVGMVEN